MNKYLFKVSIENVDRPWNQKDTKPVYVVATDKENAASLVSYYLQTGLKVNRITCLGEQMSGVMFSGAFK